MIPLTPNLTRDEDMGGLYQRYSREQISQRLRIMSNQRNDLRERLGRLRAAIERSDSEGAAAEAEDARRMLGMPRTAPVEDGEERRGGRSMGAVLMIQGLAQMQGLPPSEQVTRRRFRRNNNVARGHVTEQANMIANLLT